MKLLVNTPEKLFFTSDTHFGHTNVLSHANRPFRDIKEHDESLIMNWNSVVPNDGIVIHQGDFAMGVRSEKLKWILETLNGDIYLVKGNHEKDIMKKSWAKPYFKDIKDLIEITVEDEGKKVFIFAFHYPCVSWNKSVHGSFHTFGHTHGNYKNTNPNAYEVGVDVNNFFPISYYDLLEVYKKQNADKKWISSI